MKSIISLIDCAWLMMVPVLRFIFNTKTTHGPLGEYLTINWTLNTVTFGDPTGHNTYRFRLNEYNELELYKGICGYHDWNPDTKLGCWREWDTTGFIKKEIDNRIYEQILEE